MQRLTALFPLWALLASIAGLAAPDPLAALKPAIVPLLGVVMFGMGMTLTPASFLQVLQRPRLVGLGVLLQFALMPLLAWLVGHALGLPPQLLAGLVLVGSCPGGTASNVVCYLARGDVALSITLTTASTLLAIIATPLLTWAYVGQTVPVPVLGMLSSILKVVVIPVALGVLINTWVHSHLRPFKQVFPLISVIAICVIIAIIVGLNRDQLANLALPAAAAVVLHNLLGLGGGYLVPRLLGYDLRLCRTLAIEVGMQNSGLGVALAVKYFSAAAALPGALFSIWHNLSGSLLAGVWSRSDLPVDPPRQPDQQYSSAE